MSKRIVLASTLVILGITSFSSASAISSLSDIETNQIIPTVAQPIVGPSNQIPPAHWSYKLMQKLQTEIGFDHGSGIQLDGEHPINRTEMAVLLSDISSGIQIIENKMSEREKTQFEILQEEFQSEVKVLEARIQKVETSVQDLSHKVDTALSKDTLVASAHKERMPELYGSLHMWNTFGSDDAPVDQNFRIRRANIGIKGNITDQWQYNVMLDPSRSTSPLKDLYLDYTGLPHHTIRIGQMKPGITYDSLRSSSKNFTAERSMIGQLGNTREQGAALLGAWKYLDYQLGVYNGEGENARDKNDKLSLGGRVAVRPLTGVMDEKKWGKLELGGSVFEGKTGHDELTGDIRDRNRYGMEARYIHKRFEIGGEYLRFENPQKPDQALGQGWYMEGVYKLSPKWNLVSRYDVLDPDRMMADNTQTELLIGINHLVEKYNVRVGLNYMLLENPLVIDGKSHALRILVQHTF